MASSLSGLSIVITRPAHQATYLHQELSKLGANATLFPCIKITPLAVESIPSLLDDIDIIIFISPNAVDFGIQAIPNLLNQAMTKRIIAAVGESTAKALHAHGVEEVITPNDQFDSEGLLATDGLQKVSDKNILIVKGVGGRPYLKDILRERGADVHSLDVYQRVIPTKDELTTLPNSIDLILFTSSQSAVNFLALAPIERFQELFKCQTMVGHPKIGQKVSSLGFEKLPIIATSPSDMDFLDAITQWVP